MYKKDMEKERGDNLKQKPYQGLTGQNITLRDSGKGRDIFFNEHLWQKAMYLFVPDTAKRYLGLSPDDLREIADTLEALNKEVLKHA